MLRGTRLCATIDSVGGGYFVRDGETYVDVDRLAAVLGSDDAAWAAALAADRSIFAGRTSGYDVSEPVVLSNNHRIYGCGGKNAVTIRATAEFVGDAVLIVNGSHTLVSNTQIDASAAATDCVRIVSGYEPAFEHVKTIGGTVGFNLLGTGLESRFSHCSAIGADGPGFWVQNVADAFSLNCSTDDCEYGLRQEGGSVTALHFHTIKSHRDGFYIIGGSYSQYVACHSDTSAENGFYIFGGGRSSSSAGHSSPAAAATTR